MLTVKMIEKHGNRHVDETISTTYIARWEDTGKPALVCNQRDGARCVWTSGMIYVMNDNGATVDFYDLD